MGGVIFAAWRSLIHAPTIPAVSIALTMPAKARLALGTTALCAIVLLPFAARFFDERQTAIHTRTAVSDATLLIRQQQFE
ncbi:uncharacterized protein METZ01_LOCUS187735, partial [marine metagenome]